jgi:hypothetical protein
MAIGIPNAVAKAYNPQVIRGFEMSPDFSLCIVKRFNENDKWLRTPKGWRLMPK